MINLTCDCGKPLKVRDDLAGKKVKCPGCAKTVPVPAAVPNTQHFSAALTDDRPADPYATAAHETGQGNNAVGETLTNKLAAADSAEFLSPPQAPDEIGRLGSYRVLKILGKGGMGMVLEAEDPQLKRRVALKVMLPRFANDADAKHRFLREAQAAAALEHDHIIAIYQVGEDRVPFLAMPLLKGESLADCLKREGKLPLAEVMRIGAEIADGLAAAHEAGLIHRDIKPANVWLDSKSTSRDREGAGKTASPLPDGRGSLGRVKLLDFGLARPVGTDETHLTATGVVIGTPAYMAPEQARGIKVDFRADLFSLGCVLYQMATGELPFKGNDTFAILTALAVDTPIDPRELDADIPEALRDLIVQLLEKKPENRPASARDVQNRLSGPAPTLSPSPGKATIKTETKKKKAQEKQAETVTFTPGNATAIASKPRASRNLLVPGLAIAAMFFLVCGGAGLFFFGGNLFRPPQANEADPSNDPSLAEGPDRDVAEWALDFGGQVMIKKDGKLRLIKAKSELPAPYFEVIHVTLPERRKVSDAGLARLKECKGLTVLIMPGASVSYVGWTHLKECTRLTHLDVRDSSISEMGLANFKDRKGLLELHVGGPNINDAGLAHFKGFRNLNMLTVSNAPFVTAAGIDNFKNCKNLLMVDLSGTPVGDDILASFTEWNELTNLSLNGTKLSDVGLAELARGPKLKLVQVKKTNVSETAVKALAAKLPGCRIESDFGVFGPTLDPDRVLAIWVLSKSNATVNIENHGAVTNVMNLPTKPFKVEMVHFGNGYEPTDADLERFRDATGLARFGAERSEITDKGVALLASFSQAPKYQTMFLNSSNITDVALKHVTKWNELQSLSLNETKVTDKGVSTLKDLVKLTNLKLLRLDRAKVTEPVIKALAAKLPGCRIESDFGVFGPTVVNADPDRAAAAWVLSIGGAVGVLEDKKQSVVGPGAKLPAESFQLEAVYLGDNSTVTDGDLERFKDCKDLALFNLAGTKITKKGVAHLKNCVKINHLVLAQTPIEDDALVHLRDLPILATLELSGCARVTNAALPHITNCKSLTTLFLNATNVTDIKELGDLTRLHKLRLSDTKVTNAGLAAVARLKKLENLTLSNTPISEAGLEHLTGLSELKNLELMKVNVTKPAVEKLAAALPGCKIESDFGVFGPTAEGKAKVFVNIPSSGPLYNVVFDKAGNLFVSTGGKTIEKVTPAGAVIQFINGLDQPFGIAIDAKGDFYVADRKSSTIRKYSPAGKPIDAAFAKGFDTIVSLAFDQKGNLFCADRAADAIFKVTPQGDRSTFVAKGGDIKGPSGLAFDKEGNLYVSNRDSHTVCKVSPAGKVTTFVSGLKGPAGIAFDGAGNLYVANDQGDNHSVHKYDFKGVLLDAAVASKLDAPFGLAFDKAGNLYVVNMGAGNITRIGVAGP